MIVNVRPKIPFANWDNQNFQGAVFQFLDIRSLLMLIVHPLNKAFKQASDKELTRRWNRISAGTLSPNLVFVKALNMRDPEMAVIAISRQEFNPNALVDLPQSSPKTPFEILCEQPRETFNILYHKYLLRKGACVNGRSGEMNPPILIATMAGNEELFKLLLLSGANIEARGPGNEVVRSFIIRDNAYQNDNADRQRMNIMHLLVKKQHDRGCTIL